MRVGINATPMLVSQKTGVELYAKQLIVALANYVQSDPSLELYLYFHLGNPYVQAALLPEIRGFPRRVKCRVIWHRRGYGVILPLLAKFDGIDLLHLLESHPPWFKPCPVLLTIHHVAWKDLPADGVLIEGIAHRKMGTRAITMADAYISVSQHSASALKNNFAIMPERIWVVHHGVDHMPVVRNGCSAMLSKYGLNQYILYVGALQYRKKLVRLLQAYSMLQQRYAATPSLVLVGRDGLGSEAVYAEIARLGLGTSVRVLGYVNTDDLAALYTAASLFVYPSLYEGFGIPILEAMRYGTVVVASNVSAIPEVGGDAVLYFDPYDIEGIADTMYRALINDSLRSNLQDNGYKRVAYFTWKLAAEKTARVYRAVLNSRLAATSLNDSDLKAEDS